ncbi:hypothetical protein [Thiorhodococcus fuscus]|uniref:Uncharacterized protein n=1 Tax=Thiorhodococcus fuscus TaxID=527200 RepID=A0ABW4YAA3_9GAMM
MSNLARTAAALQTPGTDRRYGFSTATGAAEVNNLIQSLKKMDTETASRVLEKTNQLSLPVPLSERPSRYLANGTQPNSSPAANDIHDFTKAISTIEPENIDETVNSVFDNLSKYSDDRESELLEILGIDPDVGIRLMEKLSDFEEDTQDKVISYMSGLAQSISPFAKSNPGVPDHSPLTTWQGIKLDYDANAESVNKEMMDQFVSLTENYDFNNTQLSKMTSELSELDNLNQRAYLDITTVGLERLLGKDKEQPVNFESNHEAMESIEKLQSSNTARLLIAESRFGEKRIDDGHAFYEIKDSGAGRKDQKQTIELLITDAWLNREEPRRAASLATKLSSLEANQRDELVDELHQLDQTDKALSDYGPNDKGDDFEKFLERTNVIHESDDLDALLSATEKLDEGVKDDFWRAADFMNKDVNKMIDIVNQSASEEVEFLIEYINDL